MAIKKLAWMVLASAVLLSACSASPTEETAGQAPSQSATTNAVESLSKEETCDELNNIVKVSQDERGIADHRPFIAADVKDLAERAHPDLAPDLHTVADTANEPSESEPANAANLALDDACKITEFLTEAGGEDPAAPEATEETPTAATQVAQITDLDGYTFDIAINYSGSAPTKSIENDKPGFASAVFEHTGSMEITNTTEGRGIDFDYQRSVTFPTAAPHFMYLAVYSPESAICNYSGPKNDDVCKVLLMSAPLGSDMSAMTLAPGETRSLDTFMGVPNTGMTARVSNIPEEQFDQVAQSLTEPIRHEIIHFGPGGSRFPGACGDGMLYALLHATDGLSECEWVGAVNWG